MGLFGNKEKKDKRTLAQKKYDEENLQECDICGMWLNLKIKEDHDHWRKLHIPAKNCSSCGGELTVFTSEKPTDDKPDLDEEFIAIMRNTTEGVEAIGTAKFYECQHCGKIDLYRYRKYEQNPDAPRPEKYYDGSG
ncbi:hypothetical protein OAL41_00480 [Nitrosopumilus sp.]|nr:hypothetical protein [Nitrosopumilus sp.]